VKRSKAIFYNLILMTCVTLGMRFVSLGFNVYITGKIGAEGIGLYSLIMSVGGFAITFATSGVNLASTRLTAEAIGRGSERDVRRAMTRCICYSLVFGCTATLLLYILAEPLSVHVLSDARCILPLKVLSLGLPFISLGSALSGYFTAVRRVVKNASVQICEQFINISITIRLIALLMPKGTEYACTAVILGSCIGESLAFLASFIVYRFDLHRHNGNKGKEEGKLTSKMLSISIPVAVSAYVRSGLVSVEHILIPYGLKKYGAGNSRALASYGTLHGMAMPIILFPMSAVSAFAGLLVPEISGSIAAGEHKRVEMMISRVIRITLAFGIGCAGMMVSFGRELGNVIYSSADAGMFIEMMAPLIPVMYFDHIVDGMLKGFGEQLYSMRVNILDSMLSVILVYLLLPEMGIFGYVVIIYAMEIINTSLSVVRLLSVCDINIDILNWFVKPLCCVITATSLWRLTGPYIMPANMPKGAVDTAAVAISSVIYLMLLRVTMSFDSEDIKWFKNAIK